MRKESKTVETVGDLRAYLEGVPDNVPIGRLTNGHYQVNKVGDVGVFLGELPVGRPGEEVQQVILRVSA
ncbi:hypothetical protein WL29_23300 [Burkholderia ubonensis]|uniref:Uncharacterized protein n=1 Tax=Burkholderia ubonensis TaxID=101571 RepID=A0A119HFQ3_9BURK|nr:hypothetical protein [Burkholderia ubonensis]KWA84286.1 hypothetical protein WL29_23300 [Burkholderia ubonensis]